MDPMFSYNRFHLRDYSSPLHADTLIDQAVQYVGEKSVEARGPIDRERPAEVLLQCPLGDIEMAIVKLRGAMRHRLNYQQMQKFLHKRFEACRAELSALGLASNNFLFFQKMVYRSQLASQWHRNQMHLVKTSVLEKQPSLQSDPAAWADQLGVLDLKTAVRGWKMLAEDDANTVCEELLIDDYATARKAFGKTDTLWTLRSTQAIVPAQQTENTKRTMALVEQMQRLLRYSCVDRLLQVSVQLER